MKDKKHLKENDFFHSEIVIKVLLITIGIILFIGFEMIDHFIFKKPISYGANGAGLTRFRNIPDSLLYLICIIFIISYLRKHLNSLVRRIKKLINYNETGKHNRIINTCIYIIATVIMLIIMSPVVIFLLLYIVYD